MNRKQIDQDLADINATDVKFFINQDGKEYRVFQTVDGYDYMMWHGTKAATYNYICGLWAGFMISRKIEDNRK